MKHKIPLRSLLVKRGLAKTPEEAERSILAARVKVDDHLITQAGMLVLADAKVRVSTGSRYVSRGGLKLEGALQDFSLDPSAWRCIDAGASTGGFTDCLLKAGAQEVTAVDVGYGQFDWKLRVDQRVILFERTNIAKVSPEALGAPFDFLVADLSFTSLAKLAPQLLALLKRKGQALTLVKPQFELPKHSVKKGIVQSFDLHVEALRRVSRAFSEVGLAVSAMSFSCILGPKGNTEFWILASREGTTGTIDEEEIVRQAHAELLDVETPMRE